MTLVGATAIAALGLVACGTAKPEAQTVSSPDLAAVESKAQSIFVAIGGTGQQREAVHYLEDQQLNAAFLACMKTNGQPVKKEFLTLWQGWTPNPTSLRWMGILGVRPSQLALANAEAAHAEDPLEGPAAARVESAEYQEALASCDAAGDGQVVDLGNLPGKPEGSDELMTDFLKLLEETDANLGEIDPYYKCMSDAGVSITPTSDLEGVSALYEQLLNQQPQPPLPGEAASAAWTEYLRTEQAAVTADASCRASKNEEGLALLSPQLDAFAQDHSAELETLVDAWDSTLARAQAEGMPETS